MATVVVPFRAGGKSRLPASVRTEIALAMLGDVLDAATAHAERVRLVTDDAAASLVATKLGVELIADPGGGQGPAVQAALGGIDGCCLVVNADLPCATPEALARLAAHGAGFVAAADGTTNALSLPGAGWFAPLYGPGSATRFASTGLTGASIPELEHDVDTLSDLDALTLPPGLRTLLVLSRQRSGLARTQ